MSVSLSLDFQSTRIYARYECNAEIRLSWRLTRWRLYRSLLLLCCPSLLVFLLKIKKKLRWIYACQFTRFRNITASNPSRSLFHSTLQRHILIYLDNVITIIIIRKLVIAMWQFSGGSLHLINDSIICSDNNRNYAHMRTLLSRTFLLLLTVFSSRFFFRFAHPHCSKVA